MTQTTNISIEGMTCNHCTAKVQQALSTLPGVSTASVDLANKAATVTFNPESTSIAKVMQTVQQAGFKPTGFSRVA